MPACSGSPPDATNSEISSAELLAARVFPAHLTSHHLSASLGTFGVVSAPRCVAPTPKHNATGTSAAPIPRSAGSAGLNPAVLAELFRPALATLGASPPSSSSSSSSPDTTALTAPLARDAPPSSTRADSSRGDTPSSSRDTHSDTPSRHTTTTADDDDDDDPPSTEAIRETVRQQYAKFAPAARKPAPPPIPEKCLTWCSQRDRDIAMCRMVCLRRRAPLPSKEAAIARLASATHDEEIPSGFFAGLKHRLMPYSLIFIKGTPEGVVGRYMEELESDDGQYDFGPLSRHAPAALRRKSTGNMEWFDWGESGYMLHLPLTSLFAPVVNLPENAARVLGPPQRLLQRYIDTFSNGTQEAALKRLATEIVNGGGFTMLGRMRDHVYSKQIERSEREREARARAEESLNARVNPVKDKEGKNE